VKGKALATSNTVIIRERVDAKASPDDRLRRMIQYSRALMMKSKSCGVLDTRFRGYDG
jgi:hypothetical protein